MTAPEPIPLARPELVEREEELVLDVLRSRHLSLGPMLPAFEQSFGEHVGAEHVSAVSSGTAAVTRVLLDSTDGHETWGSIGVSENIIEASWEALVDSLEYAFQPKEQRPAPSAPGS